MPTRLSGVLNISSKQLYDAGVYDSWIDYDNLMVIDAALFKDCPDCPNLFNGIGMMAARQNLSARFNVAGCLASMVPRRDNDTWIAAIKVLIGEKHLTCSLGYCMPGITRSLTNPETAGYIFDFLMDFEKGSFPADIVDLLPLLGQKIRCDLFNDLMVSILAREFTEYTEERKEYLKVRVPLDGHGQPIVFVPKALLRNMPIGERWENGSPRAL